MKTKTTDLQLMRVESKGVFAVRDILAQFERLTRGAQDAERRNAHDRETLARLRGALAEIQHAIGDLNNVTCTKKRVQEIVNKAINYDKFYPAI